MENKKRLVLVMFIILNIILSIFYIINTIQFSYLSEDDKQYISKIQELKTQQNDIQNQINKKNTELSSINKTIEEQNKVKNGTAKYIMKINISQSHFPLGLEERLKDMMNDIDIYIEVSEDYYKKYNVGDTIADDFRTGSLIFKGSFGNWKVKVADKQIV